jgi:TonB family protein
MIVPAMRGQDAATLKERLRDAEKTTSLSGDDVAPYHVKIAVLLYDEKGKPSEQGTVEEWWAGAGKDKRVYAMPSYSATVVREDGKVFRTPGVSHPPAMVELLLDQVERPLPEDSEVENAKLEMKKINYGKVPLECIMLAQPIKGLNTIPMGLFPTYCFDPGKNSLRLGFNYGTQLVIRNSIATFQNRFVSLDVVVRTGDVTTAKGHVAVLTKQAVTDADLAIDGLVGIGNNAPVKLSSGVTQGMALKRPNPIYPQSAKENHVSGTVVLHALIGTDGHIFRLTVLSSSDPDLAIAALAAVRQWVYKPYQLLGEPVEVETTINVTFTFGGP